MIIVIDRSSSLRGQLTVEINDEDVSVEEKVIFKEDKLGNQVGKSIGKRKGKKKWQDFTDGKHGKIGMKEQVK